MIAFASEKINQLSSHILLDLLLEKLDLVLLRSYHFVFRRGAMVLLLHLVQQHRGQILVANTIWLPIVVVGHQFGIDLGDLLRDEAVLPHPLSVVVLGFVEESDRPQLQQAGRVSPMSRICSLKRNDEVWAPS